MGKFREDIRNTSLWKLRDFQDNFTEKQRVFFNKLYPDGIRNLELKELNRAIMFCEYMVER